MCTAPIRHVNSVLALFAEAEPWAEFLDVGSHLIDVQAKAIVERLMPDAINPSAEAWHEIFKFDLMPLISKLLKPGASAAPGVGPGGREMRERAGGRGEGREKEGGGNERKRGRESKGAHGQMRHL